MKKIYIIFLHLLQYPGNSATEMETVAVIKNCSKILKYHFHMVITMERREAETFEAVNCLQWIFRQKCFHMLIVFIAFEMFIDWFNVSCDHYQYQVLSKAHYFMIPNFWIVNSSTDSFKRPGTMCDSSFKMKICCFCLNNSVYMSFSTNHWRSVLRCCPSSSRQNITPYLI